MIKYGKVSLANLFRAKENFLRETINPKRNYKQLYKQRKV